MYKITRNKQRKNEICKRMRDGKELRRRQAMQNAELRTDSYVAPDLRKVVIVIDYDIEPTIDIFKLHKTNRIDSYQITHNNNKADNSGWSSFCKKLSVFYPRLTSSYYDY